MISIRTGILAILLFAFSGLALAEKETQMIAKIGGDITVSADGSVKSVSLMNVKEAKLRNYLEDNVKSWTFYPVEVNGRPIQSTSKFSFDLIATFLSGGELKQIEFTDVLIKQSAFEVEIKKTNGFKYGRLGRLEYPVQAFNSGAEATIELAIDIAADGKIKNAAVNSVELINANTGNPKRLTELFVSNALKHTRYRLFSKDELSAHGCLDGCVASYKVEFIMGDGDGWKPYLRIPVEPVPWVVASEMKDMNESEQSQIVRLKVDPTGKPVEIGG